MTARQGLDLLDRDPDTKVIVLVSKPPARKIADELVNAARLSGKPVVVDFIGYATTTRRVDNVHFATSFDETAELAVRLAASPPKTRPLEEFDTSRFAPGQRYLRGLFSGGTLVYEALLVLQDYLPRVYSNAPLDKQFRLSDSLASQENTILDLGEDEFTVGRLHPMLDNDLRLRRLAVEAADPRVAVILIDVVLGYGAHPDPASELAPAITEVCTQVEKDGRHLQVVAVITGTDEDPQDMPGQVQQLEAAGVKIFTSNDAAARHAGRLVARLDPQGSDSRVIFKAKAYPNQAFSAGPRIAPEDQVKIARALSTPVARTATSRLREAYALSGDFQPAGIAEYAGVAGILKDTWGYR